MKPIFKEELEFLNLKLGINLPKNCWRNGNKIYLNHCDKKPFLTFKVNLMNNEIIINKYNEPNLKENLTFEEEYELIKNKINDNIKLSIDKTKEYVLQHLDLKMFVSISGGKDSDVMKYIVDIALEELKQKGYDLNYNLIAFNTTNETSDTYKYLKKHHHMTKENIISPKIGFYQWIVKDKNYFTPSMLVRNCCEIYKEGQLKTIMNKDETTLTFLGMRSNESWKRKFYDWDLNDAYIKEKGKANFPVNWLRFLPIVKWTDEEIWLFILHNKLNYNHMYNLGFDRVGCAICPYMTDYTELLVRYNYPKRYKKWEDILEKRYEIYDVQKKLKWTKQEWCNGGKWKLAMSKEYELISRNPTNERIKELAKIKGISEDMAKKYFKKKCKCGKKLNPSEISMFLKIFGRYEDTEDNRQYLCKKCLCEELDITSKEYREKMIQFTNEGCELF